MPAAAYGHQHQQRRAAWGRRLAAGETPPCRFCGQPVYHGQPWDLDHRLPAALGGANGPSAPAHRACNRRDGGALGLQLRWHRDRTLTNGAARFADTTSEPPAWTPAPARRLGATVEPSGAARPRPARPTWACV